MKPIDYFLKGIELCILSYDKDKKLDNLKVLYSNDDVLIYDKNADIDYLMDVCYKCDLLQKLSCYRITTTEGDRKIWTDN